YNSVFAFTSVNFTRDLRLDLHCDIQIFQIHGELYHLQGPLQLGSQELPQFALLLFYYSEYAMSACIQHLGGVQSPFNRASLLEVHYMLETCNPFIPLYKTAKKQMTHLWRNI